MNVIECFLGVKLKTCLEDFVWSTLHSSTWRI